MRACWARTNGAEVEGRDGAPSLPDSTPVASAAAAPGNASDDRAAAQRRRTREVTHASRASATWWAGPEELGRHLVVRPGDDIPPPWSADTRIVIDAATLAEPADHVEVLRRAHAARSRLVIELRIPFGEVPDETDERALHVVGPTGELLLGALHHLVWCNSVVLDEHGAWYPAAHAARLAGAGAQTVDPPPAGAAPSTTALPDVGLPDGTHAWIDGGPLRWSPPLAGFPVVAALAVEHGSLRPFGSNDSAAALAPDQLAAVTHPTGAARIIAPAGSGKTRVLTERARHLVRQWALPPSALSLVAYNRRAQLEMQDRLSDVPGLQVRTLNAIALAVLNGVPPFAPQPRRFTTITESDVRRLLGQFVQSPRKRSVDPLAPWLAAMSATRLGLRRAEDIESIYDGDVDGLSVVLPQYEQALRRNGSVDFDGQIVEAIRLLLTDPHARRVAQRANRVLLADEFQDLTPAHVLLLRLLSAPDGQVFGVGDDDQTIYGYNGADPRWLLEYATLFPGAGEHPLEVNYRCPADVVEQADRLLRRNLRRVPKTIRTNRPGTSGMRRVSEDDPVAATARVVHDALAAGAGPSDVVVLARVNATLVPVQVALAAAGVPVVKVAGAEFMERTSVRSALAWVRLATGSVDTFAADDLAEALRRPSRSLSPRLASWVAEQTSLAGITRLAARLDTPRDAERVLAFADDLVRFRRAVAGGTTAAAIDMLCDDIGLAGTLATLDLNRRGMNAPSQSDDLLALRHLAAMHDDPATFPAWLAASLRAPGSDAGVTLATVHRVKGQEWPDVVVHLADAEQFPHRLADDITEERRLFHVAITRTSERVTLVSGRSASPFLRELVTEPTEEELRPTRAARATGAVAVGARSAPPPTAKDGTPKGPFTSGQVIAGTGLIVVDQGHEWLITGVAEDDQGAVVAVRGDATRRFRFGAKVVTAGKQRGVLAPAAPDVAATSPAAFDQLRQLRERLRGSKPAYTVFDDATLERIALAGPRSLADLARVKGVGPAKLEQYGDQVVGVIDDIVAAAG